MQPTALNAQSKLSLMGLEAGQAVAVQGELRKSVPAGAATRGDFSLSSLFWLLLLAVLAFLVMGYHPGIEDDAFYLSAIKRDLNPLLFPYDADFFRLQFQATAFDKLVSLSVRLTHLPLQWDVLLWQFASVFFVLHGCWRIARRCFSEKTAQWAGVSLVAVLLTLPVSGTGINLADQYLHPRIVATVAILAAIVNVMDRRLLRAGAWLAFAFVIHALMAGFGISFCLFLLWTMKPRAPRYQPAIRSVASALLIPFGWMFESGSDAWRQAAATRSFYFLRSWHWYEWLGVIAPPVLLYGLYFLLERSRELEIGTPAFRRLASALLYYSVFQTIVGLLIMFPSSLERLRPFEPMRYLHLLYLLFFLLLGGLLGRYVLRLYPYRWALWFVPLTAAMLYAQLRLFPASTHLELPGTSSENAWVQAFAWIRDNTPINSRFALDPRYLEIPGEDYHAFRALAERSVLADYVKDGGMVARVPELAPRWLLEVRAQNGWQDFDALDLARLRQQFGVNWIIVSHRDALFALIHSSPGNQTDTLACPYANGQILVCRLY